LLGLATAARAAGGGGLPDAPFTPGLTDPVVTQDTLARTICSPGWTATRRPPPAVTDAIKRQQLDALGLWGREAEFEEDHLIPLSLGGAPADARNLWPQPRQAADGWTAGKKDRLENALHARVCAGAVPLAQAQQAMARDWTAAYILYVGTDAVRAARFAPRAAPALGVASGQCPGDVVVWVNVGTGVFHLPGSRWYGRTRAGAFACERAAVADGDRAAGNGQ
jgi:hypothetical protein